MASRHCPFGQRRVGMRSTQVAALLWRLANVPALVAVGLHAIHAGRSRVVRCIDYLARRRLFDELERLQARGLVARDVSARHLFVSVVSMIAYPILDPLFVDAVWPASSRSAHFDADRRAEIVTMALARMRAR